MPSKQRKVDINTTQPNKRAMQEVNKANKRSKAPQTAHDEKAGRVANGVNKREGEGEGAGQESIFLRGLSHGLSEEMLRHEYITVLMPMLAKKKVKIVLFDGDLFMQGSYTMVIPWMIKDFENLKFIAFKNKDSEYKLMKGHKQVDRWNGISTGYDLPSDTVSCLTISEVLSYRQMCEFNNLDFLNRFTIFSIDGEKEIPEEKKSNWYVEFSMVGLRYAHAALGINCADWVTIGVGNVVKEEFKRLEEDNGKLYPSQGNVFPLNVSREE